MVSERQQQVQVREQVHPFGTRKLEEQPKLVGVIAIVVVGAVVAMLDVELANHNSKERQQLQLPELVLELELEQQMRSSLDQHMD